MANDSLTAQNVGAGLLLLQFNTSSQRIGDWSSLNLVVRSSRWAMLFQFVMVGGSINPCIRCDLLFPYVCHLSQIMQMLDLTLLFIRWKQFLVCLSINAIHSWWWISHLLYWLVSPDLKTPAIWIGWLELEWYLLSLEHGARFARPII